MHTDCGNSPLTVSKDSPQQHATSDPGGTSVILQRHLQVYVYVHVNADARAHLAGNAGVGVGEDLKTHILPSWHWGLFGMNSAPVGWSPSQVQHDGAVINLARGGGTRTRVSCVLAIVGAVDGAVSMVR
jgi:hypothetical protein